MPDNPGAIIGDEIRPKRNHLQGKVRLSGARFARNDKRARLDGYSAGVENDLRVVLAHTGKPTTNRAPLGSDVKSASVGRMFSAQITPPWASTICFEIARPRPELLPK